MPFSFDLSDELKIVLKKLSKKDPELSKKAYKKISQIVDLNDENTIDHFKNLKKPRSAYKKVHIGNFVLLFKVFKEDKFILFDKLKHHDHIYD